MNKLKKKLINRITEYYLRIRKPTDVDDLLRNQTPGVSKSNLLKSYYSGKIEKLIYILLAGIILCALIIIRDVLAQRELGQYRISRAPGSVTEDRTVSVRTENYDYGKLTLHVSPRKYSQEELDEIFAKAEEEVRKRMLENNRSLEYVDSPLQLSTSLEDYPVHIRWETSDYMLIHEDGTLGSDVPLSYGSQVQLRMYMTLEESTREYIYDIIMYPKNLSEEERARSRLEELIAESDGETATLSYMQLPASIDGEALEFKMLLNGVLALMPLTIVLLMIVIWVSEDKDLRTKNKERSREILREYPEFVGKLKLLIESGMSIRSALSLMAREYEQTKVPGAKLVLYEELIICDKKLREGISESICLESFARGCGVTNIRKLSSLLVQNLRKGNEGLSRALEDEVRLSYEERKNDARRLGEEATTKLIFPMILELGVVMILIMIPAYMSFGM